MKFESYDKTGVTGCVKAEKFEIGREKFAWDRNFCSRQREVRDMEVRDRERKLAGINGNVQGTEKIVRDREKFEIEGVRDKRVHCINIFL